MLHDSSKTYSLIISGGRYQTSENDNSFVVSPVTKTQISTVSVTGAISAVGDGNAPAGEVVINSGEFDTDISDFAKENYYCGKVGSYRYVREKEYSDKFSAIFHDNKLVLNYAPPTSNGEFYTALDDFFMEYTEVYLAAGDYTFESDTIDVMIETVGMTEAHTVQIEY